MNSFQDDTRRKAAWLRALLSGPPFRVERLGVPEKTVSMGRMVCGEWWT
jgi:hypothetical protein